MCALAVVPWLLQKIILYGYVDWDTTGWLWQSVSGLSRPHTFLTIDVGAG